MDCMEKRQIYKSNYNQPTAYFAFKTPSETIPEPIRSCPAQDMVPGNMPHSCT